MVNAARQSDDDKLLANESPLAKMQAAKYVEHQKSADTYRNISGYLNWVTTAMLALTVGFGLLSAGLVPLGFLGIEVAAGVAPTGIAALVTSGWGWALTGAMGAASMGALGANVHYSRKATEIGEKSNVLYSDIDSQNQARRMVQAFAKAQAPEAGVSAANDDTPFTSSGKSWVDSVGGSERAAGSWQEKIVAQADREDAIAMQNLRG